jgi:hypothetical protein
MRTVSASSADTKPVVIKISPAAHLAVFFLTLALLSIVLADPAVFSWLLVIPVACSVAIVRLRTTADARTVTARRLVGSQTLAWEDIDGLRFDKKSWAIAHRKDGSEVRLPAVTFNTLPQLTEVSGGRVPNPYA